MKITKSQLRKLIREEIENVSEWAGIHGGRTENPGDPYAQARATRSKFGGGSKLHDWQVEEIRDDVLEKAGYDSRARAGMFQNAEGKKILSHMYSLGKRHGRDREARAAMEAFVNGRADGTMQGPKFHKMLAQFKS